MNKHIMSILMLLSLTSCHLSDKTDATPSIHVGKEMDNLSPIKLSEFCDKISYVPLETSDSVLVGRCPKVAVTSDRILVSSIYQPLFVFDRRTGKYLNNIGHKGDDPEGYAYEDYLGILNYWVDAKAGFVFLLSRDGKGLLKYDMEGRFIGKVDFLHECKVDLSSSNLFIENDTAWAYNKFFEKREQPLLVCFSMRDGTVYWEKKTDKGLLPSFSSICRKELSLKSKIEYGGDLRYADFGDNRKYYYATEASSFSRANGRLLFKENFVDTLYQLDGDKRSVCKTFDMGRFAWPYEDRYQTDVSRTSLSVDYFYCTDRVLLAHLTQGLYADKDEEKEEYMLVYSFDTGKTRMASQASFVNDMDAGMDFPVWGTTPDNKFFSCLSAIDFVESEEQKASGSGTDKPLSVSPEDNPVIVLME